MLKSLTDRFCGNTDWTRRDLLTALIVILISTMILGTIIINGVFGVTNRPQIVTYSATIGDITFSMIGSGQGPDILLLHGFPEGHQTYFELIPLLNSEFTLTIPEMRGYNMSGKPPGVDSYIIDKLTGDISKIIDYIMARNGGRKVILAGHDFGGILAYVVANQQPVKIKGLITINAPHVRV
jgi:pimeloyl-ACP methyl ester carboxylesterase